VSVREIAELTARLRALSAPGAGADTAERAAFLADKDALIERVMAEIPAQDPSDRRETLVGLAEPSRPDDPAEIAARVADLTARTPQAGATVDRSDADVPIAGAEQWLSPSEETVTRAEAADRLVDVGYDRASAETMITEYQHESSRAIGVPVYAASQAGTFLAVRPSPARTSVATW